MNARAAARAIDALRRGWPVRIAGDDGALVLLAVETTDAPLLAEADPQAQADLLISASRAEALRLTNQKDAADPEMPVRVRREAWVDLPLARAIADPVRDLATPMKGPFRAVPLSARGAGLAALRLARHAGILPAFFILSPDHMAEAECDAASIAGYGAGGGLHIATRARLPVAAAEDSEIVAFRSREDPCEHIALRIGHPDRTPPLVRLHSECLTGDVLGSLKCDCGPQLRGALNEMASGGWGILLYLRQEGRGIGLINKMRAYALQDQGFDTVDANTRLGFAVDSRDFGIAAAMLKLMHVPRIRLLTNNPAKVAGLESEGIVVTERLPLKIAANPHNARYLDTKRDRTGHQL